MRTITKLCADHLRAFCNNHGVKLKSAHAHELVAAYLGYNSKAAMLADTLFPIENLAQAQILVLTPSLFIDQRRKCLEDLPPDLPDTHTLGAEMFVCLKSVGRLSGEVFVAWGPLGEALTKEYLQKHGDLILPLNFLPYEKARYIFNKPLYEFKPKIKTTDNRIKLTISNRYYGSHNVHFQTIDVVVTIKLQRIAGHVGYANPEVSVTNVSYNGFDAKPDDNALLNPSVNQGVSTL